MKPTEKDKPVHTIPEGAWEAGMIHLKSDTPVHRDPNTITTDSQGNGYPVPQGKHIQKTS